MGRSFFRPRGERLVEDVTKRNRFFHAASDRHYEVVERGGSLYQRRYQLGARGETTNVFEKRADYVVGSGRHSRSYLHRGAEGKLYQLPLAWYAENGGYWAMSPGYDRADHKDFRRAITYDCMFCHNGYPRDPPPARAGDDAVFPGQLPEGIDCQRCHGPGGAHVAVAAAQKPKDAIRASILNPKRLSRDRQMEVCMQCHLETTSRPLPYSIVRYHRGLFSYRPDEPLSDYILHWDAAGAGHETFEIAHHAYRLRKSACFLRSGTLTCITCHDPHSAARPRAACQGCHPKAHRPAEDCAACHMPKRRTGDVIHVVMTDHYIQRRRPACDLLAPLSEQAMAERHRGEVVPYYPASKTDELYYAVAQVTDGANLPGGIPLLEAAIGKRRPAEAQFYFELAEAYWKNGQAAKAVPYYEAALERRPDHRAALRNLGVALRRTGDLARAAAVLERAPDDVAALVTLGGVYLALGRPSDAIRALRKAATLDPENPEARNNLGQALAPSGDAAGATAELREAIRIRPDYAEAHNNLANQLEAAGDSVTAADHFERAIRHAPGYAQAHYNYGTALASHQHWQAAESHLREAVRLAPDFAEAHNNLGNVYAAQGRLADAITSFRAVLRAAPSFDSARLNLALALAAAGRLGEARQELEQAARSADPQVRARAQAALERVP